MSASRVERIDLSRYCKNLRSFHGNGYPPQSRGRNPGKKIIVSGLFLARQGSRIATYLPNEGLDATGTTVDLVEGDLTNNLVAVVPVIASVMIMVFGGGNVGVRAVDVLAELLDLLNLGGQAIGEGLLQGL